MRFSQSLPPILSDSHNTKLILFLRCIMAGVAGLFD